MLGKDAPQLFTQRAREQVQEDLRMFERECREDVQDEMIVALEVQNRLSRIRRATEQAVNVLSAAPLDTRPEEIGDEICENELPPKILEIPAGNERADGEQAGGGSETQKCENEPAPFYCDPRRVSEYLDPSHRTGGGGQSPRGRRRRRTLSRATPASLG